MDILQPKLVPVDSYAISHIDERIQCISFSIEQIALSLNGINPDDAVMAARIHTAITALNSDSEALSVICEDIDGLHRHGLKGASDAI